MKLLRNPLHLRHPSQLLLLLVCRQVQLLVVRRPDCSTLPDLPTATTTTATITTNLPTATTATTTATTATATTTATTTATATTTKITGFNLWGRENLDEWWYGDVFATTQLLASDDSDAGVHSF